MNVKKFDYFFPGAFKLIIQRLTDVNVPSWIDVLHPLQEVDHVLLAGLPGRDGGVAGVQRVGEVVKDKLRMQRADRIFSV